MPTLSEALRYYLKEPRRELTNHQYSLVVGRLIDAIGPKRDVARVSYEDLVDYMEAEKSRGLRDTSIASYVTIIRAFFNWCVDHRYITHSPADLLRRPQLKKVEQTKRTLAIPAEDLWKMHGYARQTSVRNLALFLFILDTSCRAGGAASLQRQRLHLDRGYAVLDEKGGVEFRARFGEDTGAALAAWLDERPQPAPAHDGVWTGLGPLYRPLTPDGISIVIRVLAKNSGASQEWSAHNLRHSTAEAFAKAGFPVTAVKDKLGHRGTRVALEHYFPKDEAYIEQVSRDNPLIALRGTEPEPARPKIVPFRRSV